MKRFALAVAFVLVVTVPMSAAEIPQAAPATTPLLQQIQGAPSPRLMGIKPLTPYCSTLQGTSCPSAGATTPCTDVCHNQLSCTCYNIYAPPYYVTVIGHAWSCDQEC